MSKYLKVKRTFTSRTALRAALQATGISFEEARPGQEINLVGYHGDQREQTATFIIRRQHIGSLSNDLGWHWNKQEKAFEEIVSEFDSSQARCTGIRKIVGREYLAASAIERARAKGYRAERRVQDGQLQVVVTGRV